MIALLRCATTSSGVEAGKIAAYALLGRPGYEQQREALRARPAPDARYIV